MIQDLLVSFRDNIKSKTTNPFFGTLIIVWIVHNWVFIYTLFNFDKKTLLSDKIIILEKYLEPKHFSTSLLWCVLTTFVVLFMSYVFLNASRVIVNYFEKSVTPFVCKITDKSSVVLKSEYNLIIREKEKYELKYEKEKESRLRLQDEIDKLENKIKELILIKPVDNIVSNENSIQTEEKLLFENLEKLNYVNSFNKVIENIINDKAVDIDDSINYFIKIGLITKGRWFPKTDRYFLEFTDFGKNAKDYFIREYILKRK